MVALITLGSIILQNLMTINSDFSFLLEIGIVSAMLALSFVMILFGRRDVERLIEWYLDSFKAKGAGTLIKNSFYILIFSYLGTVALLNTTSVLRGILANYLGAGITSAMIFLIMASFTMFLIYLRYGRIKKMLESMDASLETFSSE